MMPGRPLRTRLALAAALALLAPQARAGPDASRAVPPPAPRLPPRLGLGDALRLLAEGSLEVASAEEAVAGAAAQVRVAGALPNPALGFGVGRSWDCPAGQGCANPSWTGSLGDQGALSFVVTGQRGLAVGAAEKGLTAATASRDDVLRGQTFLLKLHFVNAAMAARALRFTQEEVGLAREATALAEKRLRAGAISEADVARVEVLQLQMEQGLDRADQAYRQARSSLAQVLGARGEPAEFEVDAPELSSALAPPRLIGASQASLTAEALARRPDVLAARAQLDQARLAASLARRQVIPPVSLQASYAQQGSPGNYFTPPTATLGLSVPLPVLYQQQGQIGQADAAARVAEIAAARLEAQATAEVASAWAAMTSARSAAQRAEQRLLDRSRSARDLVKIQYAKGAASLLELLDAERTHVANEIDYLRVLAAYWVAVFQLEQAAGVAILP
jgi:cobalt-zinc-cadmium efflux system outer membrane protein